MGTKEAIDILAEIALGLHGILSKINVDPRLEEDLQGIEAKIARIQLYYDGD